MRAARYDIYLEQGATFKLPCQWQNHNGSPVDLTGVDFLMQIRPTKDSSEVILQGSYDGSSNVQSGSIRITEDGAAGTFILAISDVALSNIDFSQAYYDLEVSTAGETFRLLEGIVRLSKEVSRG